MTRIFSSLAIVSTCVLWGTFWLGWQIEDAASVSREAVSQVTLHLLAGVGSLCFAAFVHALVLTYFMGTGRWLEETCAAYGLGKDWQARSRQLKWRLYPMMVTALLLLVGTGALGGAADPASALQFQGIGPLTAAQVHLTLAVFTLLFNAAANILEFVSLSRNSAIINGVLTRVREMRVERGLPV